MNWIQSILYGFISGLSEFLPVSSQAHQRIMDQLFGNTVRDPIRSMFIHIGVLLCLLMSMQQSLSQIKRERNRRRNRRNRTGTQIAMDSALVRNAALPMIITTLILTFVSKGTVAMPWVSVLLLVNGLILFVSERSMKGNKDAKHMTVMDSWLIGISFALGALPGISAFGAGASVAAMNGGDRRKVVQWMLLLSIPALFLWVILDLIAIFSLTASLNFFANLFGYILSAVFAFIGAHISIYLIRLIASHSGYMSFAYYSWGVALFSFVLYLIIA